MLHNKEVLRDGDKIPSLKTRLKRWGMIDYTE